MKQKHLLPILYALIAAALFGASAPFAKHLLGEVNPIILAGLLYLGSGLGLAAFKLLSRPFSKPAHREAKLHREDLLTLFGAIAAGGIAAPILLLFSLRVTPATTASLLLNFEAAATSLLAVLAFKEALAKRGWIAVLLITLAGILLSVNFAGKGGFSAGALGILGACALWGLDNNLTGRISTRDPLTIVTLKGLIAGSFSLVLGLLTGGRLPPISFIGWALLLGLFSYGASITLFIYSMRSMGSARTSALFATSPLAGILFSYLLFKEIPGVLFWAALGLMALGSILITLEKHAHAHVHAVVVHEHSHTHTDAHHNHTHSPEVDPSTRHSHPHQHEQLEHDHTHFPDLQHRHTHEPHSS
jgi:drug/metabolite transporter (DMT)-like permease